MNSRTIVDKAINFDSPPRIPRQLWILPWAEGKYPKFLQDFRRDFPDDIISAPAVYKTFPKIKGDKYTRGIYADEWGCEFINEQNGIIGIIKKPLIADWSDLEKLSPPEALLNLDFEQINAFCGNTDQYVLSGTTPRPFERLQFLRTMEQALLDLLVQPPELVELLKRIHVFYLKEIEAWASTDIDGIAFMDDWGTQTAMLASPDIFRHFFKPMYKEYAEIAHHYGKKIFLHSDGYILDIIPDLIEVGIDVLNSQVFCMGLKKLGDNFRGQLCFWGEIDRQYLLSQGTREEIQAAVMDFVDHLYSDGGIIAQCEFGLEAKPENIRLVFELFNKKKAFSNEY